MRIRRAAFIAAIAACGLAAACIPDLITDPLPDAAVAPQPGQFCGDGILTVGLYDGGFAGLGTGEQCDPGIDDAGADASVIGCSNNCQVECEGGVVDPYDNHCYFSAHGVTSLLEGDVNARQECRDESAHVVTFADERERGFVFDHFVGDAGVFWMGLTLENANGAFVPIDVDKTNEPGWSPSCPGCYSPPNVIDGSIPKILSDAGGSCILNIESFGWSLFPCSQIPKAVPVVCEREPRGDLWIKCNFGLCATLLETAENKRYLYSLNAATADQAAGACTGVGGSLVVFDSRQERETLLRSIINHFTPNADGTPNPQLPSSLWIGLSIPDGGDTFQWDQPVGLDGSPWGDNQPVEASLPARAYAILSNDNYDVQLAHDDDETTQRQFICQY